MKLSENAYVYYSIYINIILYIIYIYIIHGHSERPMQYFVSSLL